MKNLKNIVKDIIKELDKKYTKLSIALLLVFTIFGAFTPLIIETNDFKLTFLSTVLFIVMVTATFPVLIAFLEVIDKYKQDMIFSKKSIASLFVKKAKHEDVNFMLISLLLSFIYVGLLIVTHSVFPLGIIAWLVTLLAFLLGWD